MLKIRGIDYYTIKDLIGILKLSKNTIQKWRKNGDIISIGKLGVRYLFTLEELRRCPKTKLFFEEK